MRVCLLCMQSVCTQPDVQIVKDGTGKIVSAVAELNPGGDFKKTEKKVTWLPDSAENVAISMSEFDYLIKVPNLLEGDNFEAAINPVTKLDTCLVGEPAMRLMQPNDIIQVERRAFFRCDRAYLSEDRPAVLFSIPDGRVKGLFNLGDRLKVATK
jgi:glutamyl-tRNA synthetase